jgi:hypothetical protein
MEAHRYWEEGPGKSPIEAEEMDHKGKDIEPEPGLEKGLTLACGLRHETQVAGGPGKSKAAILARKLQGATVVGLERKRKIGLGE